MEEELESSPEPKAIEALISIGLRILSQFDQQGGGKRNLGEEAVFLRQFSFKNADIARIIGSTPNSVKALVSAHKKSKETAHGTRRKPTNK